MECEFQYAAADQNVGRILRCLYYRNGPDRVTKMGGYLFFRALVVHWPWSLLELDRAGCISLESVLDVGRRLTDAAGSGDRSFMAILVMGWKMVFLSDYSRLCPKPQKAQTSCAVGPIGS